MTFDANHFDIRKTYNAKFEPNYYDYSNATEIAILSQLFPTSDIHISDGNHPEYDAVVRLKDIDIKVEVKTTSKQLKTNHGIWVECSREIFDHAGSGQLVRVDSGLLLSESDIYVFVHPEYNKNKVMAKVRIVPTNWLREVYQYAIDTQYAFTERNTLKKPQGFNYDIYSNENHFWVGDFNIVSRYDWDLSKLHRQNINRAHKCLMRYMRDVRPIHSTFHSLI